MVATERFHHVITIPYTRNKLPSWLYGMLLAVYAILIKTPTGKHLYSCFNLFSNGILSDSTHIDRLQQCTVQCQQVWLSKAFHDLF